MTALIIILCILFFFFILLLFPVTVSASFEDEFAAKVTYLFIHYKILPQSEKAEQKQETTDEEKEKKKQGNDTLSKIKGIIKQKGFYVLPATIKEKFEYN